MSKKQEVLILCTGNSCRSQMAEGLLREIAGDRFEVFSAGLAPKPVHPLAVKVMQELGIDISGQRSTDVKELLGRRRFDYVIFVCTHAQKHCPAIYPSLAEHIYWPFEDPDGVEGSEQDRVQKFREVRDLIAGRFKEWVRELPETRNLRVSGLPWRSPYS